jgi:hypothetical protein
MKTLLILLLSIGTANATLITVDLGPPTGNTSQTTPFLFSALNGTALAGQTLSLDFSFLDDQFVHITDFTSNSFDVGVSFRTNGSGVLGFLDGTGHLSDINGNPIPGLGITGSASRSDGTLGIGLFPLQGINLARPFNFYDVHFDITFPDINNPSIFVTGGEFTLINSGGHFGIGPFVPDSGSTFLLLGMGALVIMGCRSWLPSKSGARPAPLGSGAPSYSSTSCDSTPGEDRNIASGREKVTRNSLP